VSSAGSSWTASLLFFASQRGKRVAVALRVGDKFRSWGRRRPRTPPRVFGWAGRKRKTEMVRGHYFEWRTANDKREGVERLSPSSRL
jgi:hypothetical protein